MSVNVGPRSKIQDKHHPPTNHLARRAQPRRSVADVRHAAAGLPLGPDRWRAPLPSAEGADEKLKPWGKNPEGICVYFSLSM